MPTKSTLWPAFGKDPSSYFVALTLIGAAETAVPINANESKI
jgi:hypothetical protein